MNDREGLYLLMGRAHAVDELLMVLKSHQQSIAAEAGKHKDRNDRVHTAAVVILVGRVIAYYEKLSEEAWNMALNFADTHGINSFATEKGEAKKVFS